MKGFLTLALMAAIWSAWAVAGSGNTIILSGWPPAETCIATTGSVVSVEACAPTVATRTLTAIDGRCASVAESAPGSFSSCKPGSMFIIR